MLGFVSIATSLGGIVGGMIYPWVGQKICARQTILLGGGILSAGYIGYVLSPLMVRSQAGLYLLLFISGALLCGGVSFIGAAVGTLLTINVDNDYRARIGGIFNSMATMAIPIVSVIVSGLSTIFSVTFILMLSVVLCMIVFAVIAIKKISFEVEDDGNKGVQAN